MEQVKKKKGKKAMVGKGEKKKGEKGDEKGEGMGESEGDEQGGEEGVDGVEKQEEDEVKRVGTVEELGKEDNEEEEQLKEQHVVYNIESDSVQQSSSIRLGVPGVIEERRDYDGHDLLSDDEKRFLSTPITYETVLTTTKGTEVGGNHIHDILFDGSMTEGYVIDAYFDILDERILNEDVKNYWRCLFMKHFVQRFDIMRLIRGDPPCEMKL
ncbi:hypothetical protein QJS10_CPA09g00995 [Acorus calamus]|uniref:Uncharacterized protein n=1 Tax=Acorus calamus TaxID=4465 RepID=A0AAV9E619_ACOCL|nr:hypothetical protein QJS10_CPA09g00995 [Acorus calamus]